jgi:hypothetical protein
MAAICTEHTECEFVSNSRAERSMINSKMLGESTVFVKDGKVNVKTLRILEMRVFHLHQYQCA